MKTTSKKTSTSKKKTPKNSASEEWTGIEIRCNLDGNGTIPRTPTSNSPDIILAGRSPLADPSILTSPDSYNNPYDNQLYIGEVNYIYVRGKNFTNTPLSGTWNLYYVPSNIIAYPYLWEKYKLSTANENPNPSFTLNSGEIGASQNAFTWVPNALPGDESYSLIAFAKTEGHGNPVAGVNTISSLDPVLANNANIAQRNVSIHDECIPSINDINYYNQGSEAEKVDMRVIFKNIPKGSSWRISSGTPLNGSTLSAEGKNSSENNFSVGWPNLDIPADWKTGFNFSITFGNDWNNIPENANPQVELRAEFVQSKTKELDVLGQLVDLNFQLSKRIFDYAGDPMKTINIEKHKATWNKNIRAVKTNFNKKGF